VPVENEFIRKEPVMEQFVSDKLAEEELIENEASSNLVVMDNRAKEITNHDKRQMLRFRILITDDMTKKLRDLKESR
jgi:hypothetical protein